MAAPPAGSPSPPAPPPGPATLNLIQVRFSDLPAWSADTHAGGLAAVLRSCVKLNRRSSTTPLGIYPQFGRLSDWQQICSVANHVSPDDRSARRFFEEWFVPYRAQNGVTDQGLFTGYYEPLLRGSWQPSSRYRVPIYRPPPGTGGPNRGVTLPSRAQIDAGALAGRGLELLWIDDAVDAFFLHIQGSGQVQMADGSRVRIGYAGKNGHSYYAIGAELIRRGEIPQERMSMQAIRGWLAANPQQAPALMRMNGSYVFFRLVDGDGPIGAQGVALLPGRSIAVDPAFVPYGVPVWLDTTDPLSGGSPLRRLVVAQDTGGAIKGPIRGDLFWGSDEIAAEGAGLMKQPGRWFLLLPRSAAATS
jgi:membrane-bound lytic murein transglycosylase A